MSERIEKVNQLLKKELGELLSKNVTFKSGIFVTIEKVDTTPDLRYTDVFISIFPPNESDYVLKTLAHEMYALQGKLNRRLHMKPLPRIVFCKTDIEEKADELERLIREDV